MAGAIRRAGARRTGKPVAMDFTPEDMEAIRACFEGIDHNIPVVAGPAAAKLLMPNTVRTLADILARTGWPAEQLRLVVERWQPAAEVRIERIRCTSATTFPFASSATTFPFASGIILHVCTVAQLAL